MERKTDYQGQEKHECVKPAVNKIETRYMEAGLTMEEQSRDIVYGKEKIRVILQFPETTEEMSLIKKEVSEIGAIHPINGITAANKKYEGSDLP